MSFFRDLKELIRFYLLPDENKSFLFYVEHTGYISLFRPIIEALLNKGFNICYISSDLSDLYLNDKRANLFPFLSTQTLPLIFKSLPKGTICFTTTSDLWNTLGPKACENVFFVFMPHAMVSHTMACRFGSLDHYHTIFSIGPYYENEIRKTEQLYGLPQKELVQTGYIRLDAIIDEYKNHLLSCSAPSERPIVLIGSSWGVCSFVENEMTLTCQMIDSILENGLDVILRYHPETLKKRRDVVSYYDSVYQENSRVKIEKSVADNESMLKSSCLVSDGSGVALEFAFGTLKPVLFIDMPKKIINEKYTELGIEPFELKIRNTIGKIVSKSEMNSAGSVIFDMIKNGDDYRDRIERARDENIFSTGNSVSCIVQKLSELATSRNRVS